jgi:hypothetical protein
MQQFNLTQPLDSFPQTIYSENPFFGYDGDKDENVLSGFENQPFDVVYSTPPSTPEKPKLDHSNDNVNNEQEINQTKYDKNDLVNNYPISMNPYIPLNGIPMSGISNDMYTTGMLNNGSIFLPRSSIITVDPFVYLQILNNYNSNLFSNLYPQLYSQLFYQQLLGNNITVSEQNQVSQNNKETKIETPNPRKRKAPSNTKPQRRVRPKVVPEKGAIQCIGMNRKKNQRCRNAALMEFIGPRPKYCAEHIHLDPECLYMKCGSKYQKVPGDKKGCREVVLKEFGLCHKHYRDSTDNMVGEEGLKLAQEKLERVNTLLNTLETEAMKAKKTNADLYQRKNKLLPKFQELKTILLQHIDKLKQEGFGEETK